MSGFNFSFPNTSSSTSTPSFSFNSTSSPFTSTTAATTPSFSLFGTPSTAPAFGTPSTTTTATTPSLFSSFNPSATTTTTTTSSLFSGSQQSTTSTPQPQSTNFSFDTSSSPTPSFGFPSNLSSTPTTTTTSSPPLFGTPNSLFGSSTSTAGAPATGSIFGSTPSPFGATSSAAPISSATKSAFSFGTGSGFGSTPITTTTATPGPTTTTTSSSFSFGTPNSSSSAFPSSVGFPSTTATTTTSTPSAFQSPFGNVATSSTAATTTTSTPSAFQSPFGNVASSGTPASTATTPAFQSPFGNVANTTTGAAATTTTTTTPAFQSLFGSTPAATSGLESVAKSATPASTASAFPSSSLQTKATTPATSLSLSLPQTTPAASLFKVAERREEPVPIKEKDGDVEPREGFGEPRNVDKKLFNGADIGEKECEETEQYLNNHPEVVKQLQAAAVTNENLKRTLAKINLLSSVENKIDEALPPTDIDDGDADLVDYERHSSDEDNEGNDVDRQQQTDVLVTGEKLEISVIEVESTSDDMIVQVKDVNDIEVNTKNQHDEDKQAMSSKLQERIKELIDGHVSHCTSKLHHAVQILEMEKCSLEKVNLDLKKELNSQARLKGIEDEWVKKMNTAETQHQQKVADLETQMNTLRKEFEEVKANNNSEGLTLRTKLGEKDAEIAKVHQERQRLQDQLRKSDKRAEIALNQMLDSNRKVAVHQAEAEFEKLSTQEAREYNTELWKQFEALRSYLQGNNILVPSEFAAILRNHDFC